MNERIGPRHSPLQWPEPYAVETTTPSDIKKKGLSPASEAHAASYYYQSSIKSLIATPHINAQKAALKQLSGAVEQKSAWGKFKDWFSNLVGIEASEVLEEEVDVHAMPEQSNESVAEKLKLNQPPHLEPPADSDKKYAKAVNELNLAMIKRSEDEIEKFQEEMRKASSQQIEVIIHWKFVEFSLNQRGLKENSSIDVQQELLRTQKKNQSLQKVYYDLQDEIASAVKTNKVLRWVNVGQTCAIVAGFALTFATGGLGAPLAAATSALALAKGGTTFAQGTLQYKNDLRTGELFLVNQDIKANASKMKGDLLPSIQLYNDDIGAIFKTLKQQLDNHHQAAKNFTRHR